MSEKKITEGAENIENKSLDSEQRENQTGFNEEKEIVEKTDVEAVEKVKQMQGQIASTSQSNEEDVSDQVKNLAKIEKIEEQINKLTEIASQDGPKKALKIARALNSNYMIDEMHDRLIDEEKLRQALIRKGFIEEIN